MFIHVQDSLTPLAQYMQQALGSDHAVSSIMQRLADTNLSKATKARQQEQQKLQEVMHVHMDTCMAVNCCHNNIYMFFAMTRCSISGGIAHMYENVHRFKFFS